MEHKSWLVEIDDAMNIATITSVTLRGRFGNGNRFFHPGQRLVLTKDVPVLHLFKGNEVVIQSLDYPGAGKGFIKIGPLSGGQMIVISHDDVTEVPLSGSHATSVPLPHDCFEVGEPEPKGYGI